MLEVCVQACFQIQGVLTSFHGSAIIDLMLSGIMILNWDTFY